MRLLILCLLGLAAWACVCVRAQDQRVSCNPCRDEEKATTVCPVVQPSQCRSGRLTPCGCCDTCLVYLENGDFCVGILHTNGVCNPPKRCVGNICRNP